MLYRVFMALCAAVLLLSAFSHGEQQAMVHTLDGKKIVGVPQQLNGKQLEMVPGLNSSPVILHPGAIWHLFTAASLEKLGESEPAMEAVQFPPPTKPGVLLTNGAFVAGEISAITGTAVTVKSKRAGERQFPTGQIARIQFHTSRDEFPPPIPDTATGVITISGLFSDGDIISLDEKKVVIDSIVSGPKSLPTKSVHAVVLTHAPLASSRYILKLTDGSLILTDSLSGKENGVGVNGMLTGPEMIPLDMLEHLSAGYRFLEDVCTLAYIRRRPEAVDKDDLTIRNAPPTASRVRVDSRRRKVEIAAGSALAFFLEKPGHGFSARIGVPPDYPEDGKVLFRVRADNKLVYQSQPMNSASPPELIGVRAPMSNYLVLEIIPAGETLHETPGVWIEPVLHRQ
ncbi:MAG: NPCBM/NEW2 domain-containing protein [Kiritimatiellia bacterium]